MLGGGCFWCLEAVYKELRGVRKGRVRLLGWTRSEPDLPAGLLRDHRSRGGRAG